MRASTTRLHIPPFLFLRSKLVQSNNDRIRFKNYRYKRAEAPSDSGGSDTSSGVLYTGNGRFDGYIMELMERIRSVIRGIDFEYEVELVPDGKYGAPGKYSKIWNGMVGEVVRGTADVAAGPLTVTAARKGAVDFSYPFMSSGIQALALHTSYVHHDPFRIMFPFTIEVWFLNIILLFLVALMIWAANRYDPYEWRKAAKEGKVDEERGEDFTFFNSVWYCASTLFLQGDGKSPKSNAGRCIAAFWYLFVLFMVFLYIINVQFFLTSQTRVNYIKSASDLKAEKTIKYGTTYKGTDTYHVFKTTKSLKSMWHKMNNDHKSPYVYNLKEGVQKVRESNGRFVLLDQSPVLRYVASQKPCDVEVTGSYLHRSQFAFATAKGSPLADYLSSALEALRDNGVLEDLERDWWDLDDRWNRCRNQTRFERDGAYSLFVNDLVPLYYMLVIGMVGSILVFIGEYVYYNSCGGDENTHRPRGEKKPKKKKDKKRSLDGGFRPSGNNFNGARANTQAVGGAKDNDPNMWI